MPSNLGESRNKMELLQRLAGTELVNPFSGAACGWRVLLLTYSTPFVV